MSNVPESEPVRWTYVSASEDDTNRLGALLADALQVGDIVALNGDLGAGKTRLVRGIVGALCPDDPRVSSPTFVLVQRYEGPVPVYHFDTYRLADVDEFLDLGVDEIFAEDAVCLIEWADRVSAALPPRTLRIEIRSTGPQSREFLLSGADARAREIIRRVRRACCRFPSDLAN